VATGVCVASLVGAAAVLSAFVAGRSRATPVSQPTRAVAGAATRPAAPVFVGAQGAPRESPPRAPGDPTEMPRRIAAAVDGEVSELATPAQVDAYLNQLQGRARRQGRVTALEVEPGLAALARFRDELGSDELFRRQERFKLAVLQLARELDPASAANVTPLSAN
jgi:hypothetical protein